MVFVDQSDRTNDEIIFIIDFDAWKFYHGENL